MCAVLGFTPGGNRLRDQPVLLNLPGGQVDGHGLNNGIGCLEDAGLVLFKSDNHLERPNGTAILGSELNIGEVFSR